MFEFIKIQFALGKIAAEKVQSYVPRFLTAAQAAEITARKEQEK